MRVLARTRPGSWRLAAFNAVVMVVVFVVLAASPAPVHFPSTHWEAVGLALAAALILVMNVVVAGAAVAEKVGRERRPVLGSPELRELRLFEHYEVHAAEGRIGIVDEVLGDRPGRAKVLVVADGWFGARRFVVPVEAIQSVDDSGRVVTVDEPRPAAALAGVASE